MTTAEPREQHAHPLAMARALMHQVDYLAHAANQSEDARIQSIVQGWGNRQHHAAEMAAQMALVSVAEDIHAICGEIARAAAALERIARALDGEPGGEPAARTRDDLGRWTAGEEAPGDQ